jgi:Ran GTPase-activating protein (RanGAP) involved in mRNA processing and transport
MELDVGDNPLGDEGLEHALFPVLTLMVLETLKLDAVGATSSGLIRLARTLEVVSTIVHLDLSHNSISAEALDALVAAFSTRSAGARFLTLAMNRCALGDAGLATLCKAWTKNLPHLAARAASSKKMSGLLRAPEHLSLRHNNIRSCAPLGPVIQHNDSTRVLDLSSNALDDAGFKTFARSLAGSTMLEKLHLRENELGNDAAINLAESMVVSDSINVVDLRSNKIGPSGASAFTMLVKDSIVKRSILLSRNPLGAAGASAVIRACIESRRPCDTELDLSAASITEENFAPEIPFVSESLRRLEGLLSIDLSGNRLGTKSVASLAQCLGSPSANLVHVNLSGNKLTAAGALTLAEALESNQSVAHLNVSSNPIGAEGAVALASMAKAHPTLAVLNVEWCMVGDEGCVALSSTMVARRELDVLLSGNKIGGKGVAAYALSLPGTTAVSVVRLGWNAVGVGMPKLCASLAGNRTVTSVHLPGNNLRDACVSSLVDLLQANQLIRHVNLSKNSLTNTGFMELAEYLLLRQDKFHLQVGGNRILDDLLESFREKAGSTITLD